MEILTAKQFLAGIEDSISFAQELGQTTIYIVHFKRNIGTPGLCTYVVYAFEIILAPFGFC